MAPRAPPDRFDYYRRLNARDRAVYRSSDDARLDNVDGLTWLRPLVDDATRPAGARRLARAVLAHFGAPDVVVRVRGTRPANEVEELHGLYEEQDDAPPVITVWSRTAVHARPVAHRTFVRTLVHELCHHLDYTVLNLEDSFHTHGFYRREAAISRSLLGEKAMAPVRQLSLFGEL